MAKGKEFKRPKSKKSSRFKVQNVNPSPNYDSYRPTFSFTHMKYQKSFCISQCEGHEKSLIVDTLLRFSQLTWRQLQGLPKESGFEIMPSYRFNNLPNTLTPDITILVARYDEGGRLAGFREKDIYHIVLAGKDFYSH